MGDEHGGSPFRSLLGDDDDDDRDDGDARPIERAANPDLEALLIDAYAAFNARQVDAVLRLMHPDVEWPNGMEGGCVRGHAAVRAYWTRQWAMIDPTVDPESFDHLADGRVAVAVRQVIRNLSGVVLADRIVRHVYRFRDRLIEQMQIQ